MPSTYSQLLDATIAHLETLKARGVDWVPVSREAVAALARPPLATPASTTRSTRSFRGPGDLAEPWPETTVIPSAPPSSTSSRPPAGASPVRSAATLSRWSKAASLTTSTSTSPSTSPFQASPLPPPLPPEARSVALAELRSLILGCTRCPHLVASRNSVVFGVGDPLARILFVGEAPGADEDLRGEPFVGKAGELLTKIITAMGLTRDTVFIANILKCRPDTPGQSSGNRKPSPEEMATCFPWLERQIDLVQPRVMVALGATAVEGLLGKGAAGITQLRGSWQVHRGIPLMPTYHPAYLLRNQALSEKRKVWEDMLQVLERAGYPISTKQRGFFLGTE